MPKMSDTMTEGVLAKWHKKVGDSIKAGDVVAEIETDKATMDFESFQEGTLLYIGVEEGKAVPIDSLIAVIGEKGEDFSAILEGDKPADRADEGHDPVPDRASPGPSDGRRRACPVRLFSRTLRGGGGAVCDLAPSPRLRCRLATATG